MWPTHGQHMAKFGHKLAQNWPAVGQISPELVEFGPIRANFAPQLGIGTNCEHDLRIFLRGSLWGGRRAGHTFGRFWARTSPASRYPKFRVFLLRLRCSATSQAVPGSTASQPEVGRNRSSSGPAPPIQAAVGRHMRPPPATARVLRRRPSAASYAQLPRLRMAANC